MMIKRRRNFTAGEKVSILRAHLLEKVPVSDLCEKHGFQPTQFYQWQKALFENGESAFQRQSKKKSKKEARRIEALEAKLQDKNEVISELMEDHVKLKKELGEL